MHDSGPLFPQHINDVWIFSHSDFLFSLPFNFPHSSGADHILLPDRDDEKPGRTATVLGCLKRDSTTDQKTESEDTVVFATSSNLKGVITVQPVDAAFL